MGQCSTSAYKIQTPGNYAEESIQLSEQGESLKTRMWLCTACMAYRHSSVKAFNHLTQTHRLRLGTEGKKLSWVTKVFGGYSHSKQQQQQQQNSTRIQVWVFSRQESHVTCTTCNVETIRLKETKPLTRWLILNVILDLRKLLECSVTNCFNIRGGCARRRGTYLCVAFWLWNFTYQ